MYRAAAHRGGRRRNLELARDHGRNAAEPGEKRRGVCGASVRPSVRVRIRGRVSRLAIARASCSGKRRVCALDQVSDEDARRGEGAELSRELHDESLRRSLEMRIWGERKIPIFGEKNHDFYFCDTKDKKTHDGPRTRVAFLIVCLNPRCPVSIPVLGYPPPGRRCERRRHTPNDPNAPRTAHPTSRRACARSDAPVEIPT